jgi:hypothetical protein
VYLSDCLLESHYDLIGCLLESDNVHMFCLLGYHESPEMAICWNTIVQLWCCLLEYMVNPSGACWNLMVYLMGLSLMESIVNLGGCLLEYPHPWYT